MTERFGGDTTGGSINGIEGVVARYGAESAEFAQYVKMLKATRSLLSVAGAYFLSPDGSSTEAVAAEAFANMIEGTRANPSKAAALVESLSAIVIHLSTGGTLDEWFVGLDDMPGGGEEG